MNRLTVYARLARINRAFARRVPRRIWISGGNGKRLHIEMRWRDEWAEYRHARWWQLTRPRFYFSDTSEPTTWGGTTAKPFTDQQKKESDV